MDTIRFTTVDYPKEPGWYVFQHMNTKELVVRRLEENGVLYDIRDQRYDHGSQWREYYSGYCRIYFIPEVTTEVLNG